MLVAALSLGLLPQALPEDLGRLLAPDSALVVGGAGLAALVDAPPAWAVTLADSPLLRNRLGDARERLDELDDELGLPVLPTIAGLARGGLALGVSLRGESPAVSLAARAADPETLQQAWDAVRNVIAQRNGVGVRWFARQKRVLRGFDAWVFGDELALAIDGDVLLVANGEGPLRDMIDRARDGGASAVDRSAVADARARADGAAVWAWVDIEWIDALAPDTTAELRAFATEPGAHLLLGSGFASLGDARTASAGLWVDDDRLKLGLVGHGDVAERAFDLAAAPGARATATASPSNDGARFVLHRDLAGVFRHRVDLFDVDVLPEFAGAVSGLALFFGGADIEDEILPALSPWLTLVVRAPAFAPDATPDVPLPAAALVVDVDDAERIGPKLVGAFQTAIGLVNVESAQNMQPALVMGLELVGGVAMTTATFPAPHPEDGVDLRYNLVPACGVVDGRLVLGTHRSLVADLIESIAAGETGPAPAPGESVRLSGSFVADGLRQNRGALAMARVLAAGATPDEGRAFVESVAALADSIAALELRFGRPTDDARAFELELAFGEDAR